MRPTFTAQDENVRMTRRRAAAAQQAAVTQPQQQALLSHRSLKSTAITHVSTSTAQVIHGMKATRTQRLQEQRGILQPIDPNALPSWRGLGQQQQAVASAAVVTKQQQQQQPQFVFVQQSRFGGSSMRSSSDSNYSEDDDDDDDENLFYEGEGDGDDDFDDDEDDEMEDNMDDEAAPVLGVPAPVAAAAPVQRYHQLQSFGGFAEQRQVGTRGAAQPLPLHLDIDNNADVRQCPELSVAIFQNMRQAELKYLPNPNYMTEKQRDLTEQMRSVLIDWLNEVVQEYELKEETLYLAVNYTDRFLSMYDSIQRARLQLVGIASILIASKYYETQPPTVSELVYITDNTYSREELIRMESVILNVLSFNVTVVTVNDYLLRFLTAAQANDHTAICYTSFLAELTLQEYRMVKYRPSMIAACAVILALYQLNRPHWTATLQHYIGYKGNELNECMFDIHRAHLECYHNVSNLSAVKDKYANDRYLNVSRNMPKRLIPRLV